MTLISSTAAFEIGFLCMNLQETSIHNSLSNQSVTDMKIAIDGVPVHKFNRRPHKFTDFQQQRKETPCRAQRPI